MSRAAATAVAAAALLAALTVAGCGLGPGADVGRVALTVTREFGATPVLERGVQAKESDTVMRVLESNADIDTRYGGGFVDSIDGVEGGQHHGHPYDWFFFVDGVQSPIGAAEYSLQGSERIWWDYRDWTATENVPAVVGSWPAPFAAGYEGQSHPVSVECAGGGGACAMTRQALEGEGIALASGSPAGAIRVLVGPWARLRSDPAAALIQAGPAESGIYADFARRGGAYRLQGLDPEGKVVLGFGAGAGLVAATRRYEGPPVWVVTGATRAAVRNAAGLLSAGKLRDHYAVAVAGGKETALPVMR